MDTLQRVRKLSKLVFLFSLIFKEAMNSELINKIYEHCCKMSYEKSVEVFSLDQHPFATSTYDDFIFKALRTLVVNVKPN